MLDHLKCSKYIFMTLLHNMYKRINFFPVTTCQMVQLLKIVRVVAKLLENNGYKSWQSLENWLTGYRKANCYFGPSSTVGPTIIALSTAFYLLWGGNK